MIGIILCGGSGSRLWPLSRKNYPKQFLRVVDNKSLLQLTFERMREVLPAKDIYLVTSKDGYYTALRHIQELDPDFFGNNVIIEPARKDTMPAVLHAVKYITGLEGRAMTDVCMVVPADHYIVDTASFVKAARRAAEYASSYIMAIGVTPVSPHTGFGYICKGDTLTDTNKNKNTDTNFVYRVASFTEKPNLQTAEKYLETGKYLWNTGMYLFTPDILAQELKACVPELWESYAKTPDLWQAGFKDLTPISIDHALSERSRCMAVVEADFMFNDIGSFEALLEFSQKEDALHVPLDSSNVSVYRTTNRLIATVGLEDIFVIDTEDSTLICKKGQGEQVKKLVSKLESAGLPHGDDGATVHRPWGFYTVYVDTPTYKVKKLGIYPGAKLSLQSHSRRAEHWVVVTGTAQVTNGDRVFKLHENESSYIPKETRHRLENPTDKLVELIEVQTGDYLGEDDIVRYDDIYKRS